MIDWSKPIARQGHREYLDHSPRNGTDHWVTIGDNKAIFTQTGKHVRYAFEERLPDIENLPRIDLNKRLCWADTGDRVWFSHWVDGDHHTGRFYGSTRDGIVYTFNIYGECVDDGDHDRWLVERDDALAILCREMSESPMDQAARQLPCWGMFS